MQFCVLGDDRRSQYLRQELKERGYFVCESLCGEFAASQPLAVAAPLGFRPAELCEIIGALPRHAVLMGGQKAREVYEAAENSDVTYACLTDNEAFAVKNAVATAEGAIQLILCGTETTIRGMTVAVTGFGRVASALAPLLYCLGADVRIICRSETDAARAMMYDVRHMYDIANAVFDCDVFINTVPSRVLSNEVMDVMRSDVLMIELASPPYGYDADHAAATGRRSVLARGLPSTSAPKSAAKYLADAVLCEILNIERSKFDA